jgi:hypothetical protein
VTKRSKRDSTIGMKYEYIWKLNAVVLPDGMPLHCAHNDKIVYATYESASKAADEFERVDGARMMPYQCRSVGPRHFHIAHRLNGSQKAKKRRVNAAADEVAS